MKNEMKLNEHTKLLTLVLSENLMKNYNLVKLVMKITIKRNKKPIKGVKFFININILWRLFLSRLSKIGDIRTQQTSRQQSRRTEPRRGMLIKCPDNIKERTYIWYTYFFIDSCTLCDRIQLASVTESIYCQPI